MSLAEIDPLARNQEAISQKHTVQRALTLVEPLETSGGTETDHTPGFGLEAPYEAPARKPKDFTVWEPTPDQLSEDEIANWTEHSDSDPTMHKIPGLMQATDKSLISRDVFLKGMDRHLAREEAKIMPPMKQHTREGGDLGRNPVGYFESIRKSNRSKDKHIKVGAGVMKGVVKLHDARRKLREKW